MAFAQAATSAVRTMNWCSFAVTFDLLSQAGFLTYFIGARERRVGGPRLPIRVRSAVQPRFIRPALHIEYPGLSLVDALQGVFHNGMPGGVGIGDRIHRNIAQVSGSHQVLQGLRRLLLVISVLVNSLPQSEQIVLEYAFLGPDQRLLILRDRQRYQDHDDRHHDHQLHHGEAEFAAAYPASPTSRSN